MIESRELDEYLAEISSALKGANKYRQEIVAELRSHLIDEVENSRGDKHAASAAVHRLGSVEVVADGFNSLHRENRFRRLSLVLAITLASVMGVLVAQRSLIQNGPSTYPSAVANQPTIRISPRGTIGAALDPASGKIVAVLRRVGRNEIWSRERSAFSARIAEIL